MKIKEGFELRRAGLQYAVIRADGAQRGEILFALNETGAFLFGRLEQGISEEELFGELLAEYEASKDDEEEIRRDLEGFLENLRGLGVLEERK